MALRDRLHLTRDPGVVRLGETESRERIVPVGVEAGRDENELAARTRRERGSALAFIAARNSPLPAPARSGTLTDVAAPICRRRVTG